MANPFRYPTGARPLLIEETARRRRIESRFVTRLEADGFEEIALPILDFAEPYAQVRGTSARETYRFTDREGELVLVRSDFTPMVARALAPVTAGRPLRVFYRGDVIRCTSARLGANRDLFQVGAEIIGDPSVEADLTLLRLAASLAEDLGIEPAIVYTDAAIAAEFDDATREALFAKRTSPMLPPLARKLVAGTATLEDVRSKRLVEIADALANDRRFVLHLDDVDAAPGYYTGLRFRVFGSDRRKPVAQGGRYDTLFAHFGGDAPAAGFTFTIDDLELAS
jgi:ATP phosphoribosyltransferase regulatory subunit